MKRILAPLVMMLSPGVFAQEGVLPEMPARGATVEEFIPNGWKKVGEETGDLNKDGSDDAVLVIEDTKAENLLLNEGLGPDTLNVNPRRLVVLFADRETGGFVLAEDKSGFIPPANDAESPCLADPLLENGGIAISKGVLITEFGYWLSCGSYGTSKQTFKFRYQDAAFRLIGYDTHSFSRSGGEETSGSVNFLTGKKSVTTGGNMFDETLDEPATVWEDIRVERPVLLRDLGMPFDFDY